MILYLYEHTYMKKCLNLYLCTFIEHLENTNKNVIYNRQSQLVLVTLFFVTFVLSSHSRH